MKDSQGDTACTGNDGSWVPLMEEQGSRRWLVVADMTDMRRWGELRSVAGIVQSSVGEEQVVLNCVEG